MGVNPRTGTAVTIKAGKNSPVRGHPSLKRDSLTAPAPGLGRASGARGTTMTPGQVRITATSLSQTHHFPKWIFWEIGKRQWWCACRTARLRASAIADPRAARPSEQRAVDAGTIATIVKLRAKAGFDPTQASH